MDNIVFTILQGRESRHRELRSLAQGPTVTRLAETGFEL